MSGIGLSLGIMLLLRRLKAMTSLPVIIRQWLKFIPGMPGVGYWSVAGKHVATAQVEGVSHERVVILPSPGHILQLVYEYDGHPVRRGPHLKAR